MIDEIKNADQYCLVKRGIEPEETFEILLNAATIYGQGEGELSKSQKLLIASEFALFLRVNLELIEQDIYRRYGLSGAAPSKLSDLKYLTKKQSKDLFNITFALKENKLMREDMRRVINDWSNREKAPEN